MNIFDMNPLTRSNKVVVVDFSSAFQDFFDLIQICGNNAAQIALEQMVEALSRTMPLQDINFRAEQVARSSFINPNSNPAVAFLLSSILGKVHTVMLALDLLTDDGHEQWEVAHVINNRLFLKAANYSVEQRLPLFRGASKTYDDFSYL